MRDIDTNNNTPAIMSNAVLCWQATPRLKFMSHLTFEGSQTSYNLNVVQMIFYYQVLNHYREAVIRDDERDAAGWGELLDKTQERLVLENDMSSRFIATLGAEYKLGRVTLGLNVHNLFNTKYSRSGMNTKLIPQRGRWWMGTIAYKF